jgi:hypothetical protein
MTTKILYFEVNDGMVKKLGGKYFRYSTSLRSARSGFSKGPEIVGKFSNRIWEYDPTTDSIRYVKHRQTGIMTPIDLKEFLLIQLRAEEY